MTVLLGFADALAAIEATWALQDDGADVVAFARRGTRPPVARCKGVRLVEITAPEEDAAAARSELSALLAALAPDAVLPLCDQSVWLCDQAGPAAGSALAGPVGAQARLALDKRRQLDLARRAGFFVPPSVHGDGAAVAAVTGPGDPPWIVKPALAVQERTGRLTRPAGRVAGDAASAQAAARAVDGPVIVQPLLNGVGEGIFGLATDTGVVAWSAHRRIRMMNPRGSGSSACRSIAVADDLREAATRFVELAGWRGIFMIELLRDDEGRAAFMELNGRAWGSMALACRRGLPYPAWAVRLALDPTFRPALPEDPPELVCRYLGGELVHLAVVLRGSRGTDTREWPGRMDAARDVLRVSRDDAWYNARAQQPSVLAADTLFAVRRQLARLRAR